MTREEKYIAQMEALGIWDEAFRPEVAELAQLEREKKRMVNEVKDEVSKMAIGIASAVIERDVSETEHKDLIDGFIDKMG